MSMGDADRRTILVTGAARGIGEAVCHATGDAGWQSIGIDRAPGSLVDIEVDLTDGSSVEQNVSEAIAAAQNPISGLVNAAGLGYQEAFEDASDESWRLVLEVNLMATVRMCRLVLPILRSQTGSRAIVNFGSQAGKSGGIVIGAHYSAAKAAVMCLTKSLAAAYGPEGIRVNAVAPGIIDTPFLDQVPSTREMEDKIPLRRVGTADEAAAAVVFLLSDQARYITGEILDVNGGLLMD